MEVSGHNSKFITVNNEMEYVDDEIQESQSVELAYEAFFAKANVANNHVPALYVFGDSGLDAGNNNNLKTLAKANVPPYGIDFNNTSTGRYTNGKTFADLIAIKLGLPFSPPYLGVSKSQRYLATAGVNYAYGARKFVVGTANQLGCSPSQFCNETINRKVKPSSEKLPIVIQKLQNQLSGSSFVYVDSFNFFNRIRNAPKEYGKL
ncbi:PREDICTED: GDSL esterase/lipase At2g03980-like [Lupinus angustifolius]|uniref:GDSL esterase/lipase At2g03980-like n=1 Tax=Lupinus angustifolius TaxID=3871 RepID=UPI00092F7241|nr:PREDICTED: GDSL esterase/lipase At2g03980-like [Lupinus angustifolius]